LARDLLTEQESSDAEPDRSVRSSGLGSAKTRIVQISDRRRREDCAVAIHVNEADPDIGHPSDGF
jgi:hypothetical protein